MTEVGIIIAIAVGLAWRSSGVAATYYTRVSSLEWNGRMAGVDDLNSKNSLPIVR
jgi:hypothetical protein